MTHQLTDEKCLRLITLKRLTNTFQPITVEDSMRAAADWQLEQVLIWLENELACSYFNHYGCEIDVDDVLDDLKEAMRPQQQEDNLS